MILIVKDLNFISKTMYNIASSEISVGNLITISIITILQQLLQSNTQFAPSVAMLMIILIKLIAKQAVISNL